MNTCTVLTKAKALISRSRTVSRLAVLGLAAGLLTTGIQSSQAAAEQKASASLLKSQIASIVYNNPAFDSAKIGVYVKVISSDRVVYSYRGQAPMIPASNQKIVTTATILDKLGPDYRFTTSIHGPLPDANGIVHGNIYLHGSGDPTLTPPYIQPSTDVFAQFVSALRAAGVRGVEGDLVADDSEFDRQYLPQGWLEHYRLDSYAAPVSGLSLNGNLIDVRIQGDSVTLDPACSTVSVSRDTAYEGPLCIERQRGTNNIVVRGQGADVSRQITVDNPPLFAIGAFAEVMRSAGVSHTGKIRLIDRVGEPTTVEKLHCYASHQSIPLHEIIKETNRESDNFFAEHMYKTLGAVTSGKGTAISGFSACKAFLQFNNVDTTNMRMVDGCGLSRLNNVSPYQLVGVLDAMTSNRYYSYFSDSLPGTGQGTIHGRLGNTNARAKTGTLNNDSSLSGYVTTAGGDNLAFSLMFNDLQSIGPAVDAQDKIVSILASWPERL